MTFYLFVRRKTRAPLDALWAKAERTEKESERVFEQNDDSTCANNNHNDKNKRKEKLIVFMLQSIEIRNDCRIQAWSLCKFKEIG